MKVSYTVNRYISHNLSPQTAAEFSEQFYDTQRWFIKSVFNYIDAINIIRKWRSGPYQFN